MANNKKRSHEELMLAKGQYWDTVQLDDGGRIRVIKLKSKVYPEG